MDITKGNFLCLIAGETLRPTVQYLHKLFCILFLTKISMRLNLHKGRKGHLNFT